MIAKLFEIRDKGTFIPVLAVKTVPENEAEGYLLAASGYGLIKEAQSSYIIFMKISGGDGQFDCDSHGWGNRTMQVAHEFIEANFDTLEPGEVIDVEYILGLSDHPKESQRFTS